MPSRRGKSAWPFPLPWPVIKKPFGELLKKLESIPPGKRLAVVDYWIGLLFLVQSELQTKKWKPKDALEWTRTPE